LRREDCTFWIEIDIRWGDMDSQSHVNNAVYFTYCEQARVDFLHSVGIRGKFGAEQGPMLVSASCDFKRQLTYPGKVDVGLYVEEMGRSSCRLRYGIFRKGADEPVALGTSVNAWVDYRESRAIPLPDDVRATLTKYRIKVTAAELRQP